MQERNQLITHNTNYKEYFLQEDNCISLHNELIFSTTRRYNCFAGCKICYIDKHFEKNKTIFQRYIPEELESMTNKLIDVFKHYRFISTIDDLYWMKHNQPHIFKWYKDHSSLFYFGNMTDNGFIRCYDIIMNEIDLPNGINEFTFSDVWLTKIKIDEVVNKLTAINAKILINRIKIVQTDIDSLEWESVKKIIQFAKNNELNIIYHTDIKTSSSNQLNVKNQQQSFIPYNGDIYTVLGEANYLQYDSFFHTLIDATDPLCEPYYIIGEKFNASKHLVKHLQGKIDVYQRYINKLHNVEGETLNYKKYFQWVVDNLIVNEDYNYIPSLCFKPYDIYYNELLKEWLPTQYGLIKPSKNIKPLFEFKS